MANHQENIKREKIQAQQTQKVEDEDFEISENDFQEMNLLTNEEVEMFQKQKEENEANFMQQFEEQKQFFEDFAHKLEIYDPLDRTITDFEEMSIKREELLDLIRTQLKEINGQNLNLPLDNYHYQKLLDMFQAQEHKIRVLASTHIEKVQNNQIVELQSKFDEEQLVMEYLSHLQFFADYDLLEDAEERYSMFHQYVQNTMAQIESLEENNQRKIEEQGLQDMLSYVMDSFIQRNSIDYMDIAKMVLKLQEQIDKLLQYPPYQNQQSQKNWEYLINFSKQ